MSLKDRIKDLKFLINNSTPPDKRIINNIFEELIKQSIEETEYFNGSPIEVFIPVWKDF